MDPTEIAQFVLAGRNILTSLAIHLQQMDDWKAAFDARGGEPVLGQDALNIVSFVGTPLVTLRDGDATMQTIIAKLRTDM